MKLRLVMADDERPARDRLRRLIEKESDCIIVAEASDGDAALAAIHEHKPDAVFLDIEMPGLDGLNVVAALPVVARPAIVLVTAHPQHAARAFDAHATDYLLKPVPPERLADALERCRTWVAARNGGASDGTLKRLIVRGTESIAVVAADDVDWIGSADNYVVLYVGKTSHILRETMTAIESRLAPGQFLRLSRSTLVNVRRVRNIEQTEDGHAVVMADGQRLPITRGIREVLSRLETA